jgi:hypothetical protein
LVNHTLTGTYYHAENRIQSTPEFYVFTGPITGNTSIVGTSNQTFSVLQKPGVTYSWFVTGQNAVISGATNQSTLTVTPTHSGTAVLTLRTSSACSGTYKEQQVTLHIQTNVCLEGTYDYYQSGQLQVRNLQTSNNVPALPINVVVTCPNATSYGWQRTSGTISFWASGTNL